MGYTTPHTHYSEMLSERDCSDVVIDTFIYLFDKVIFVEKCVLVYLMNVCAINSIIYVC